MDVDVGVVKGVTDDVEVEVPEKKGSEEAYVENVSVSDVGDEAEDVKEGSPSEDPVLEEDCKELKEWCEDETDVDGVEK